MSTTLLPRPDATPLLRLRLLLAGLLRWFAADLRRVRAALLGLAVCVLVGSGLGLGVGLALEALASAVRAVVISGP